jgi:hypothetical protein
MAKEGEFNTPHRIANDAQAPGRPDPVPTK